MNFTVNEITNSIAGKPSLSECSVEELRQLTSQYPFFGPAQFLFVKKLKEVNSWQLKDQVRRASLYFQNPLWLDHLLKTTAEASVSIATKKEEFITVPATEMEKPATSEEVAGNNLLNTTAEVPDVIQIKKEEFIPGPATVMEMPVTQEEAAGNLLNTTAEVPVANPIKKEEFITEPAREMENPVTREEVAGNNLLKTTTEVPVVIQIKKEEFIPEPVVEMEIPVTYEEVVDQTRFARQPELAHADRHAEQYQPDLLVEMPKFKFEPVDTSKSQLLFEPFHTVDYFASQGIRPAVEEKPKDQFSRQLKSFTEWLKVMKKLPVSEIAAAVSVVDEKKVEKMAELSINDREVVTEAMAEVWEKQGNQVKAREIYEKLSLLNPDKSSYFAAKIDQLKNL